MNSADSYGNTSFLPFHLQGFRWSLAVMLAIALPLTSCRAASVNPLSPETTGAASPNPTEPLQVVTTILPITQFTRAVAGDRATVTQLLPTNVGPHDYQAKPEDVQRLARADVLVQNGLGLEAFLQDMVKNAGNARVIIIDASRGIAALPSPSAPEETQDHDHGHGELGQGDAGHSHSQVNPHVWLDPKRALVQVETIRDGLIAADPQGKALYTANAAAYLKKLRVLDAEITQQLQPYAGQTFVAFHNAAPYFAQSYNLKVTFLVDLPETNPSPQEVKRVMDRVRESHLKTLLTEPQAGEGGFAALAKDLQVQVSTFDPLETGGPEALEPDYYLTTMAANVNTLVTAFRGQSPQSHRPLWQPWLALASPQSLALRF